LANRLVLLLAASASAFALTGCAPTGDVALKVGDVTYSNSDVNLLTSFECAVAKDPTNGITPLSRQAARAYMATLLVSTAIDHRIGEDSNVKPTAADVASTLQSADAFIDKAAQGKDRDRLRSLLENVFIGQTAVGTIVQRTLGQQLSQLPQDQQQQVILQGIKQLRTNAAAKVKIKVDPALGLSPDGLEPATADPSLSRALSSFAKSATTAQPEQTWLDSLPAVQRCN
jgi:hypothetical protein